jgi:membrane protein implicated in regulation of membrane protease activity
MAAIDLEAGDTVSGATGLDPLVLSAILAIVAYLLQFVGNTVLNRVETKKEKLRLRNEHELARIGVSHEPRACPFRVYRILHLTWTWAYGTCIPCFVFCGSS